MRTVMQTGIALFGIAFFVACWIFVAGHQLELGAINLEKYPAFSGSLVIAYTFTGISVAVAGMLFLVAVFRK